MFTQEEAKKATNGICEGNWTEITSVSIDSRNLSQGDLFIALKGPNNDGHDYVDMALTNGATAALVENNFKSKTPNQALLRVQDTMQGLHDLGQFKRANTRAKIIGITGSVGKTGTKELLSIALAPFGVTHASQKSYNNHWGVPLTLANMPNDCQYGVFEMGMNHEGELTKLSAQVRPDIAVITNVEPAHIGHFKNVEAIAHAKIEIFSGMSKGGIAILNIDNPYYPLLEKAALEKELTVYSFGEDEEADARLVDCKLSSDQSKGTATILGEKIRYKLAIPGKHIILNSLAALLVVKVLGCDLDCAKEALKKSEPIEGRGARFLIDIEKGQAPLTLIDESYNASPASMDAAIKVLEMVDPQADGRRIAVLGDMLELGPEGPALHAALANPLLHARTDKVFTCGPQMEALFSVLPPDWQGAHADDSRKLAEELVNFVQPGDVILVKGSLGSRMAYVVQALQNLNFNHQSNLETKHNAL